MNVPTDGSTVTYDYGVDYPVTDITTATNFFKSLIGPCSSQDGGVIIGVSAVLYNQSNYPVGVTVSFSAGGAAAGFLRGTSYAGPSSCSTD